MSWDASRPGSSTDPPPPAVVGIEGIADTIDLTEPAQLPRSGSLLGISKNLLAWRARQAGQQAEEALVFLLPFQGRLLVKPEPLQQGAIFMRPECKGCGAGVIGPSCGGGAWHQLRVRIAADGLDRV